MVVEPNIPDVFSLSRLKAILSKFALDQEETKRILIIDFHIIKAFKLISQIVLLSVELHKTLISFNTKSSLNY